MDEFLCLAVAGTATNSIDRGRTGRG